MSDCELPELDALILRPATKQSRGVFAEPPALRRSPRKQKPCNTLGAATGRVEAPELFVSSQQRVSPRKQPCANRTTSSPKKNRTGKPTLQTVPELAPQGRTASFGGNGQALKAVKNDGGDMYSDFLQPSSKLQLQEEDLPSDSDKENVAALPIRPSKKPTSTMSQITQAARKQHVNALRLTDGRTRGSQARNPYLLKEARCNDLDETSGSSGEDEETDLSGFIVDDNADLSIYSSDDGSASSESESEQRRTKNGSKPRQTRTRGKLMRGSGQPPSGAEETGHDQGLAKVLNGLHLGDATLEKERNNDRRRTIEVIDLTSSPAQHEDNSHETKYDELDNDAHSENDCPNPALKWTNALQLKPSQSSNISFLPSKLGPMPSSPRRTRPTESKWEHSHTPPTTPPRSPSKTKLVSPSKLLSPSKHNVMAPRSPHRQSMDAFWDHNTVNEWHDTYSPKKAPTLSPRKNPLPRFNLFPDAEGDGSDIDSSQPISSINSERDVLDDSSDSLPSPSESPSKSRSPSKVSALRAEQLRIREEKRVRAAAKRKFDSDKGAMALELLLALDRYVTGAEIGNMAASTGGIKVIWSKTLRSTAGRANWKRTVTKPSGSPIKGSPSKQSLDRQPGVVVQHFANIELAEKIIDRPERLVNTLAHEFCHLANFMISGIRDQPHGESFKRWGKKVTSWMKSSSALTATGYRDEWKLAAVTTKHDYIVETKYMWACIGRPAHLQKQSLAMKMLEIEAEDQEGCGAEYGRHSKSIDTEKQRCGRCKGFLVQVRPTPRVAPASPRKSPVKRNALKTLTEESSGVESIGLMMEVVELSD